MISVIICHHKGDLIYNCLKALKESKFVEYEIIVVTSDESKEHFKNAHRTVFYKGGPSAKRNFGARYASGKYYFFLDDDTEVSPYFLYEMRKALDQPGVGMAYGKSLNMEKRNVLDNAGSYLTWTGFLYAREESGIYDKGQFEEPEYIFAGKGAAMAIRRDAFGKVGGFEPIYEILAEETDISWKVWFIGQKVVWVPKAVLYHAFNTKFKPWNYYYTNKRVYYNGCRNYIIMLLKFLEWKNVIRILPFHIIVWFFAGLGMFFTNKPEAGWNIWKGLAYHLFHWKDTMARRKLAQSLRTMPDKELFKSIMRQPNPMFYIKRFIYYIRHGRHG